MRRLFALARRTERKRLKQAARARSFNSALWSREGDVGQRRYASYEAYLAHQSAKLDRIEVRLKGKEADDLESFLSRFRGCAALTSAHGVLCLGARLGTEVRALIELGHLAVGIDLNPGSDNTYVLRGDFHRLVFADKSFDAVYCNALDHVFDLAAMVGEVRRVLRPGGVFVADLVAGTEEGTTPGAYEALAWRSAQVFAETIAAVGGLPLESFRDVGRFRLRGDTWFQAVFRAPALA